LERRDPKDRDQNGRRGGHNDGTATVALPPTVNAIFHCIAGIPQV